MPVCFQVLFTSDIVPFCISIFRFWLNFKNLRIL